MEEEEEEELDEEGEGLGETLISVLTRFSD